MTVHLFWPHTALEAADQAKKEGKERKAKKRKFLSSCHGAYSNVGRMEEDNK